MFGTSCLGSWRAPVTAAGGLGRLGALHRHTVASPSPLLAAGPAPELAGPRGGWRWQPAMGLLPSIRQGRFLLFLSQPWQQDRSLGFILLPPHQRVPRASACPL